MFEEIEYVHGGVRLVDLSEEIVHGVKSLEPPMVQCDGCLVVASHPKVTFLVQFSGILFNHRFPGRRLCAACRVAEGWGEA